MSRNKRRHWALGCILAHLLVMAILPQRTDRLRKMLLDWRTPLGHVPVDLAKVLQKQGFPPTLIFFLVCIFFV